MFGLIIALALVSAAQSETVSLSRETFQNVVLISIVPAFLAVLVLALGAREVPVEGIREAPNLSLGGMPRQFRLFLGIVVIFTLGNSSDAFLILRAQERGLSVTGVLGMLITFNLVYALISGPAGALSDRIGRWQLILGGWAVYGIIYLGFALATEAWHVWALYALYGVYYGVFEGTSKALVADVVPAQQRGTAYGIYNTAVGLVALPASLLAGILWQGIGGWAGFGPSAPIRCRGNPVTYGDGTVGAVEAASAAVTSPKISDSVKVVILETSHDDGLHVLIEPRILHRQMPVRSPSIPLIWRGSLFNLHSPSVHETEVMKDKFYEIRH